MGIKYIRLINVQSFKDVTFDFPKNGIIGIVGENSNGKSILGKAVDHLTSGKYNDPKERRPIINDKVDACDIILASYEGDVLQAHIAREAKDTWISLNGTKRYLRDKNFDEFILSFGLHSNLELDYSLNIHRDRDVTFLVDTTPRFNYEAVSEAATDKRAVLALERLDNNLQDIKTMQRYCDTEKQKIEAALGTLTIFNIEGYEDAILSSEELLKDLNCLDFETELPSRVVKPLSLTGISVNDAVALLRSRGCEIPKKISRPLNINEISLLDVRGIQNLLETTNLIYPNFNKEDITKLQFDVDFSKEVRVIKEAYTQLKTILEQVCPTCGRSLHG